ncbi:ATP-binding protein [Luteimonas terrae]|uniref:Oxygen sensor histidine kinase NreB n=1 Tax=Luteimonas terrae TaxID=1530191 RepID=A0ABU1XWS8_9GAMM|nr:ATP-binding protein [Luteimonas terrae]MDR7192591.1 PAS domain S-box-containing protein [Luteimonas terrae]
MSTGQPNVEVSPRNRTAPDRWPSALRWQVPLAHLALLLASLVIAAMAWGRAAPADAIWAWGAILALALLGAIALFAWMRAVTIRAMPVARCDAPSARARELRELMRLLPDGVLLVVDDRVAYANPACELMFGHAPDALVGLPATDLVSADARAAFRTWLEAPDATSNSLPPSPRMCRRDGSGFHGALTAAHTRHDDRPCTLLIVRDLTEAERMRDELAAGNRELQALAARVFTLQEDERRAISRELHDDIGQSVTAMKMAASSALDEADPQRRRDDLEDILVLADATLERLRDISILLRPPQLDALGLEAALRWHAERLLRNAGITADLQIDALPRRPDPGVEQACFRIAQEALTNVVRHARAQRVALRLRDDDTGLHLCVHDDGAGFAPEGARGLGLVIMRERAQGAGGRLEVTSTPGAGTRIEAWLPYAPEPPCHGHAG